LQDMIGAESLQNAETRGLIRLDGPEPGAEVTLAHPLYGETIASALGSLRPATRRSAEKGDEEPDKIELARLGLPHLFNSHRAVQVEHADQHSPEGTDAHHASGGLYQVMNSIILAVRVSVICHPYRLTNWLPVAWLTIRRELRI